MFPVSLPFFPIIFVLFVKFQGIFLFEDLFINFSCWVVPEEKFSNELDTVYSDVKEIEGDSCWNRSIFDA